MKKTLVALAVLAASGASFAQVAITGGVAMGWLGKSDAAGNQTSGLGVDTATIDFAVSEDLGGGLKVTAHEGFDTLARSGVTGGDTGMTLGTSAWTLTLGANQLAPYLAGNASVGGLFNGFDGKILAAKNSGQDFAGFAFMVTPAITLSVTEFEANAGLGLGAGGGGDTLTTKQRNVQYQVAYASGALKADAAYKAYDSTGNGADVNAYTPKSVARASANYDFGVAKVGGGIEAVALAVNGTDTRSTVSVAVPFGAVSFGAQYINRNVNGANTALVTTNDFNQNGYGLELDYNFSKSTKLAVNYMSWQQISVGAGAAAGTVAYTNTSSNLTEIALSKSF